jgi:hypothetical protein
MRTTAIRILLSSAAIASAACAEIDSLEPSPEPSHLETEAATQAISAIGSYPVYGIGFYGTGAENAIKNGKGMWTVEMIYTQHYTNPAGERAKLQNIVNKGFKVILRLDYDFTATIPLNDDWGGRWAFATTAGRIARDLGDLVDLFVIGNEINPAPNNPRADWYTLVFNKQDGNSVYKQIKAARPGARVAIFAPTGWPGDNNLAYWQHIVDNVDRGSDGLPGIDAFAFHAYSGKSTSTENALEDPRFADKINFRSFARYAARVYARFGTSRPIYITETNAQWYWGQWASNQQYSQDVYRDNWIKEAFQSIDEWNRSNDLKVHALCWFVYQHQCTTGCDQYENSLVRTDNPRLARARQDFAWVTANTNIIPGDPGSTLRFQAENYSNSDENLGMGNSNGVSGVDYVDTTAGNTGGGYRNQNVDIQVLPDWSGFFVGWTAPGEWLRYETLAGGYSYKLRVRYSRGAAGASRIHFNVDGVNRSGNIDLAGTLNGSGQYDWNAYNIWTSSTSFALPAGNHEIKLVFDTGSVNIDYFELVRI